MEHKVFTDGSCYSNGKKGAKGGFAALFVSGPYKDMKIVEELKCNKPSNIRAEGMAIIRCLLKIDLLFTRTRNSG
jgi:ribonuclease HI